MERPVFALLVAGLWALAPLSSARARDVPVADATVLVAAIADAQPGDRILLAPGEYALRSNVRCRAAGTAEAPIVVRSTTPQGAQIRFDAVEGFVVAGAHWRFEDLDIGGICASHSSCEHAFHIAGDADHTVIRGNRIHDFNAHIKANGDGSPRAFPDDVLVEHNELWNATVRDTSNPVTPIDVVGGRRWIVRRNFIHDHAKGAGDGVSYAAFLKGNSRDGLFEQNLIVCELLHTGRTRLGLSFGGGGTGAAFCEDGDCTSEHQGGMMRNNIVAHCPSDVGIYINRCTDCSVLHNTVYDTTGIDVRFASSRVTAQGNLVAGRIRMRDGATLTSSNNLEMVTQWASWFTAPAMLDFSLRGDGASIVDRGAAHASVTDDFCGNARDDGAPDLGAVEYDGDPCDTRTVAPPDEDGPTPPDAGMPADDAGVPADDAGSPADDAGVPAPDGSASGPDAGRDDVDPIDDGGGCGCRVGTARRAPFGLGLLLALGALAVRRRRR